eukprot:m.285468 g.285468  ORF g.285468 m.285468 type:complete len:417 (+) comp11381_c0_seq1:192-1442(+)
MSAAEHPTSPPPAPEFDLLGRLRTMPVVSRALHVVSSTYESFGRQSSIPVVKNVVTALDERTRSLVEAHQSELAKVDHLACAGLDRVGHLISGSSSELAARREQLTTALHDRKEQLTSSLSTRREHFSETIESASGRLLASAHAAEHRLSALSKTALDAVEARLPNDEDANAIDLDDLAAKSQKTSTVDSSSTAATDEAPSQLGAETRATISRAAALTSKAKTAVVQRAASGLETARTRSTQALQTYAPNLMTSAQEHLDKFRQTPIVERSLGVAQSARERLGKRIEQTNEFAHRIIAIAFHHLAQCYLLMMNVAAFMGVVSEPAGERDAEEFEVPVRSPGPHTDRFPRVEFVPRLPTRDKDQAPDHDEEEDDDDDDMSDHDSGADTSDMLSPQLGSKRTVNWYLGANEPDTPEHA